MPKLLTITPDKITQVKAMLTYLGIRESARQANISYYTAWCISKGKYDSEEPLQSKINFFSTCPITGFKLF